MHISEGILPLGWAALWFALALPLVAIGCRELRRISREDLAMKPLVGLLAAVVFIISCMPIPVPTAGTCSHTCGTAISAVLVGLFLSVLISDNKRAGYFLRAGSKKTFNGRHFES